MEWKENLIKTFEEASLRPAVNLNIADKTEFLKVKLKGEINRNYKIFFPAKTLNGKNGYRLASIIRTQEGENILIDEGWYAEENHEYFLKNNSIFDEEILGYIRFPRNAKLFTPQNNIISNEWYTYNLNQIESFLDIIINKDYFIKNMTVHNELFLIPSELKPSFRNNHLQYAITWFLMSFAFFVLFLVYLKKNK